MIKELLRNLARSRGYEITRIPADGYRRNGRVLQSGHLTAFETEGWFHSLYEQAQANTQMQGSDNQLRRQRHYTLNHLLRIALTQADGDVCEVGCWRGLSTYQLAQRIKDSGNQVALHVFDSFQGLSEYWSEDVPQSETLDIEQVRAMVACPLSVVQDNLKEFDFIKFYPGWVPERFHEVASSRFAFVHIDLDLYQPIRDAFNFFYPLLSRRGVMVFDDYGFPTFPGAQQAVDEILKTLDNPFFVPLPSGQAFLVKS
jgi:O-methyltransferase